MAVDYPKTRMDNFFAKAAGSELADDSMEPITDREYWINEMAKKTAGGGLPTIEEGDDGKVLTVSSGEAVWASGGGGGGGSVFFMDIEDIDGNDVYTIKNTDKSALSAGELIEALQTSVCSIYFDHTGDDYYYYSSCPITQIEMSGGVYQLSLTYAGESYTLEAASIDDSFSYTDTGH